MKKLYLFLFLTVFISDAFAQECKSFIYLADNSEVEMTNYDKKGKTTGKSIYKVRDVNQTGDGFSSQLNVTVLDEKGKTVSQGEGKFKCTGSSIEMDMKMSVPSEQMEAYKDMELKSDEAYLSYPTKMEAGQTLPDGKFSMDVLNEGSVFSTINYDVVNRKVAGKENVSTPAGAWDCYKLTHDASMTIKTMGIGIPVNLKVIEWYAPGVGVVKTETYSKGDKLMGSTVLTSVKK